MLRSFTINIDMHCVICVGEGAGTKEELNGLRRSGVAVKRALIELGISAEIYIVRDTVNIPKCDFVFNLCDNDENYFDSFINFTSFLESNNVPHTGNTSSSFRACYDKLKWSENVVLKNYFPKRSDNIQDVFTPCIVKHRYNHGSLFPIHILDNKTHDTFSINKTDDYFYEEFIKGKELSVSCLPGRSPYVGERDLNQERILDFQTKWHGNVGIKKHILSAENYRDIQQLTNDIRNILHIKSYMRLDLKIDLCDRVFLIDINPNCSMDPNGAFSSILALYGINYQASIKSIVTDLMLTNNKFSY